MDMHVNNTDETPNAGKGTLVEPAKEIVELAQMFGQAKAGSMLGIAQSTVSHMVAAGECRPVYNLAAKAVLAQYRTPKSDMLYFVKVSADKRELFETFVKGLNFKFRTFVD